MPGSTAFRAAAAGGAVKEVLSGAAGARPTLARRPMLVSVPSTSSPPPPPHPPPSSFFFGPAPSKEEAEQAVSNLRRVFGPATYSKFYGDEPEIGSSNAEEQLRWSNPIRSSGQERVFDAFRLLQLNPSVQKMVVSISSDKAVWDAVMKNEAVQELQKSFHAGYSAVARFRGFLEKGCRPLRTMVFLVMSRLQVQLQSFLNTIQELHRWLQIIFHNRFQTHKFQRHSSLWVLPLLRHWLAQ